MPRHDDDDDAFDERGLLKDGRTARTRMMMKDLVPLALDDGSTVDVEPWQRDVIVAARHGLADDGQLALHQPGPRYAADQAGLDAKAKAYAEMVRDMCDAWKSPVGPPAGTGNANDREVARMHNTGDAVRDAYLDSVADLTSAWSRKA